MPGRSPTTGFIAGRRLDYYVSFDNEKVGELQGTGLVDKLKDATARPRGDIVMINGSPTDNNASRFKAGAHSVLDGERLQDRSSRVRHPRLEPDNAQS